jgi:uncharacterized paraquat-inducible protein A
MRCPTCRGTTRIIWLILGSLAYCKRCGRSFDA